MYCFQCFRWNENFIKHEENCIITNNKQALKLPKGVKKITIFIVIIIILLVLFLFYYYYYYHNLIFIILLLLMLLFLLQVLFIF